MIERKIHGQVAAKHHIALRGPGGALRYEECLTRDGFESGYTILYHEHRPHAVHTAETQHGWSFKPADDQRLLKRHFKTQDLPQVAQSPMDARLVVMFNEDLSLGIVRASKADEIYFINADADELHFIHEGEGTLRTLLGDLKYKPKDYVVIPRGLLHRWQPSTGDQRWLSMEFFGDLFIPKQFRAENGQLRMDAPYSHRDFVTPDFVGPEDEGIRDVVVKKQGRFHGMRYDHSPLDVVGWDGAVYPLVFPILNFQPRVSSVHLPPSWHGTFAAKGALICSFVPRPVDFHPEAVPCPYPHSSVHIDEVLYYVEGQFTSRKGVGPASISFHPAGLPHGPHPGNYEASIGATHTDELAVMLDCAKPLHMTELASRIEDPAYTESFIAV